MANNTKNPFDFSSYLNAYDPAVILKQMQDAIGSYQLTNLDPQGMIDAQRKNLEALVEANQATISGTTVLLQRQAEMLKKAMDDASEAAQNFAASADPKDAVAKQTELVNAAIGTALNNSVELSEMVKKNQQEIAEVVNKRVAESVQEVKETLAKLKS